MVNRKQMPRAIDTPEPCWLRVRMERHGPYLPARIFQRLGLLTAEIDGTACDVERAWTSGDRITEHEWLALIADRQRERPF